MECFTCKTKMVCVDDMNTVHLRMDILECPICKSTAEIKYGHYGEYIQEVMWRREKV